MTRNLWKLLTVTALAALSVSLYAQQGPPQGPPPGGGGGGNQQPPQNLKVMPKDATRQQVLQAMNRFTAALGVKCDHCHVQGNFASDDKPEKDVARAMMKMMGSLRQNAGEFLPGERAQKLGCWTCHRGSAKIEMPPAPAPRPSGPAPNGKPPEKP